MTNTIEPEAPGTDLATLEEPSTMPSLFGTTDPGLAVNRAVQVSDVLAGVIRDKKLAVPISGREHVLVEGWTLLGSLLGVFPVTVWSHQLEDGWEARVEARTLDGRVVGAAESECLRSERKWANADDYAVRSMAQTRATSKALRQPLGFVMHLAGYETTPADELPTIEAEAQPVAREQPCMSLPDAVKPTDQQLDRIRALIRSLDQLDPGTDWKARCRAIAGPGDRMTRGGADSLVEKLEQELAEFLLDSAETAVA